MATNTDHESRNPSLGFPTTLALIAAALSYLVSTLVAPSHSLTIALGIYSLSFYFFYTNKWVYILDNTWKRDLIGAYRFFKLNFAFSMMERNHATIAKVFDKLVENHPNKVAFVVDDKKWTYQQVYDYSNKIANYFKKQGFQRGDTIALFMETRVEYVCFWLGLSRIGVVSALINTNLRKLPLKHSINAAGSKGVIYSSELRQAFEEIKGELEQETLKFYHYVDENAPTNNDTNVREALEKESISPLTEEVKKGQWRDKLIYIYTSGTTGLPKAAIINHSRYFYMSVGISIVDGFKDDDIIYDPLPIYHSAGGILGVGQSLLCGRTVVLRKKFSATNFWKDCIKYNCTIAQYIGEICRYLLSQPERPEDKQHQVRLMFGNGLRPQIWQQFVDRFNIKIVTEFYGATEGNSSLINFVSKVGAVGFVPEYAYRIYPVTLVKCDLITGEIICDAKTGFCKRCAPGEPGVFIGKINQKKSLNAFQGYADKKESDKKVLKDVFVKGDLYFNTGDILVRDEFGFYYFRDRTGDTFRWRGENVATSEVEAVISNVIELNDCTVYGVEIPHVEGKAGMAAIVDTNRTLDIDKLTNEIKNHLAAYARPLFIRVLNEIPMTGTFKLKKTDLQKDGFDINKVKDKIYYLNGTKYELLTEQLYNDIVSGKVRL